MWRCRKIFGRGPFRWTLSKRGIGWSWGIPGFRYGVSPGGQQYISIGIPGTGLYWIKYLKQKSESPGPSAKPSPTPPPRGSTNRTSQPGAPSCKTPWWKQKGL
jgi:hypothetical protein